MSTPLLYEFGIPLTSSPRVLNMIDPRHLDSLLLKDTVMIKQKTAMSLLMIHKDPIDMQLLITVSFPLRDQEEVVEDLVRLLNV